MLFHSSIRRELARTFGATLVILFTIVLTMLLIRTLGLASKGSVNPEEIMLVLGYTVIGRMPTILTLALFIAIVSTLSRMYRDSEMIIWFSSGSSLGGVLGPVVRFSWPVLLMIALLVLFAWPWSNQQTDELRERFERRSDIERVAPGEFQESSSGRRVFFVDRNTEGGREGRNVFVSTLEDDGSRSVMSARAGRIDTVEDTQFLVLESGQRLESGADGQTRVSDFEEYRARINATAGSTRSEQRRKARSTWDLMMEPTAGNLGELGWRIGVVLTAVNFVLVAVAATVSNPRAGRGGNLFFTLFGFIVYFNLINVGQRWTGSGMMGLGTQLMLLHGSVFVLASLWLVKRHLNISLRSWLPRASHVAARRHAAP
ncbi:MAG: LPS export ABC transporter permease LptF [Burkholderiales bacterium]|nr:MAG: LPS export ABC transporter permease LptF [Burkholderiales bacterium]